MAAFLVYAAATAAPAGAAAKKSAGGGGGSDLNSRLEQSSLPVLVEFWAPWCAPCRRLAPQLTDLAREMHGRVRVVRVNIDESPRAAERYGVELLPTMILFDRGRERDRLTGVPAASELRSRLDQFVGGTVSPGTTVEGR
jgi:thioredoxin